MSSGKFLSALTLAMVLMAVSLASLLIGLSNGQREGWQSSFVLTLIGIALVCAAAFFWWELHTDQPRVNLRIFKTVSFAAAASVASSTVR